MEKERKRSPSKSATVLSDEEMNTVTGGFETFPDKDGVDRHSWFVTLMLNLFHHSPGTDPDIKKDRR